MSKMPQIQLKVTHYNHNQQNHNLNERRQSPGANTKINQMLELSDKDHKADIIKMLHKLSWALLKQMKKYKTQQK